MHYANGKAAKVGDKVIGKGVDGEPIAGVVEEAYPKTDRCNLVVAPTHLVRVTATAAECLLADDIASVKKEPTPETNAPETSDEAAPEKNPPATEAQ